MSVRANAEGLRRIPLFADCDPAHLQVIAFSSERIEFPSGAPVLRAGEPGTASYLILGGVAEIWEGDETSRKIVARAQSGALLGELGMIAGLPYSINATAASPLATARISRDLFMRVVDEFPEFGQTVLASLTRKLDGSMADLGRVRKLFDQARSFSRNKV